MDHGSSSPKGTIIPREYVAVLCHNRGDTGSWYYYLAISWLRNYAIFVVIQQVGTIISLLSRQRPNTLLDSSKSV